MKRDAVLLLLLLGEAGCHRAAPPASDGVFQATIAFTYHAGMPKPVRLYEPAASRPVELWDTGVGDSLDALPVASAIADPSIAIAPGASRTFVLVLQNELDHAVSFFAAPHTVSPPESALGFKFKCLCVNRVYTVAPGQYWYRVVRLNVSPDWQGDPIEIRHDLIPVPPERAHLAPPAGGGDAGE